jgi:hypothetical protein
VKSLDIASPLFALYKTTFAFAITDESFEELTIMIILVEAGGSTGLSSLQPRRPLRIINEDTIKYLANLL